MLFKTLSFHQFWNLIFWWEEEEKTHTHARTTRTQITHTTRHEPYAHEPHKNHTWNTWNLNLDKLSFKQKSSLHLKFENWRFLFCIQLEISVIWTFSNFNWKKFRPRFWKVGVGPRKGSANIETLKDGRRKTTFGRGPNKNQKEDTNWKNNVKCKTS